MAAVMAAPAMGAMKMMRLRVPARVNLKKNPKVEFQDNTEGMNSLTAMIS